MIIEYASTNLHLHALFKTIIAARKENNSVEWTNFQFYFTHSPISVNRFSCLFIEIRPKGKHKRKKKIKFSLPFESVDLFLKNNFLK